MIKGIVRHTDSLGRVVIPKEFYKVLGINNGDKLDISLKGNELRIRKVENNCALCGFDENLKLHFTGKLVCTTCIGGGK